MDVLSPDQNRALHTLDKTSKCSTGRLRVIEYWRCTPYRLRAFIDICLCATKQRHVPGGRRDETCDHGLSRRSLRVKPPTI